MQEVKQIMPADLVIKVQEYAKKLAKKYPKMKMHRIQRKTLEYFKIKLANESQQPYTY